jgi:hypothetical protein
MARAWPGQHPGGHTQVIPLFFGAFFVDGTLLDDGFLKYFDDVLRLFEDAP